MEAPSLDVTSYFFLASWANIINKTLFLYSGGQPTTLITASLSCRLRFSQHCQPVPLVR